MVAVKLATPGLAPVESVVQGDSKTFVGLLLVTVTVTPLGPGAATVREPVAKTSRFLPTLMEFRLMPAPPVKVAFTVVSVERLTEQKLPVPLQPPPDQPAKLDAKPAEAFSKTEVPLTYDTAQNAPQFILLSRLVMVPAPVPGSTTVSTWVTGAGAVPLAK
jgi:hypothetical protein